jgi:hypothetical protein
VVIEPAATRSQGHRSSVDLRGQKIIERVHYDDDPRFEIHASE